MGVTDNQTDEQTGEQNLKNGTQAEIDQKRILHFSEHFCNFKRAAIEGTLFQREG